MNPFALILIALMAAAGIWEWWHADMWRCGYWFSAAFINFTIIMMKQTGK
jgi:hypothetical protein